MWMWAFIRLNRTLYWREKKIHIHKRGGHVENVKVVNKKRFPNYHLHPSQYRPTLPKVTHHLRESVSERLNHNSSILDCSLIPMELKNKTHKFRALSPIYKAQYGIRKQHEIFASHTLISNAILDPKFHRIGNTNFQFCVLKVCVETSKINEFQGYLIQSA